MNRDEFVKRSIERHGNTYSYDLIPEFVKRTDKVDIICPENINIGYGTPDIPNLNIGTTHPKSILGNQYTHETIWY